MWYIFNKDNKCLTKCDYKPNLKDLATRNETAIESEFDISLNEAIIQDQDGKVIQKQPTAVGQQQQALAALDREYAPQFSELTQAWATAAMDGNTVLADSIKQDKAELKVTYEERRAGIING